MRLLFNDRSGASSRRDSADPKSRLSKILIDARRFRVCILHML